jgi:hypothetical protein
MTTTEAPTTSSDTSVGKVDMKLEIQIIPVSDVDRSEEEEFYERLGFRRDDDAAPLDGLRIVQFTPPAPGPPSRSASDSPQPRLARPKAG